MSVTRQLYQLQEVDTELESVERAMSQIASQLGESQVVLKAQAELKSEHQRLEELKQLQRSSEWEIDDLVNKLAAAEEKLYSGSIKNPKELTSLQHEAEGMKARRSQLEDKALEIMNQSELAEASVATKSNELKRLESDWQSQQQRLSDEMEQLKAAVSDLKQKWQLMSAKIDPRVVEFYGDLKKQKGAAVAKVMQGICRSCRISLSTAELQQARGNRLVQCSSCGRILFLP